MLKTSLANAPAVTSQPKDNKDSGGVITTTQDILILLLPYLSSSDSASLFNVCLTANILEGKDGGVQKRGYKILTKLVEAKKVTADAALTLRQLDEPVANLMPAAKKVSNSSSPLLHRNMASYRIDSTYYLCLSLCYLLRLCMSSLP